MNVSELGLPMAVPAEGLPARVRIHEVGARDGLQNEKQIVPTAVKAEFVRRLAGTGLTTIEATSFVHPKWVPQLADAEDLYPAVSDLPVELPVLVPNERGLDRALALGARRVAVFASATESFAKANLNRTVDESLAMFEPVVARAKERGVHVRGYLSMCFGDPWEGAVPVPQVVKVCRALLDLGCDELSLGDTIGVATPGHVTALIRALAEAGVPVPALGVHFHDTYGQALSNTLAALQQGVATVDASAGGLGGCPYAKSATGNLATEDLVWMLRGLGIDTGVDLGRLVATSVWMAAHLGGPARPAPYEPSPTRSSDDMDHKLSPELDELRRTVEEFAHDVVAPKIGDFYERHEFPYEIVREMGRMGLFGLPFPEEYGGMGGDYFALGVALEELARVDSSVAITLEAGVSLGAMPLHLFGTEEQKREWLPRLCSGEILGAFGLTEPDGGSDAGATRTTARLDEATGEWVINGTKCFITNSGTDITGLVTVTAVTGRKPDGKPQISSIIVPSGTPGFTVAAPYSKVGWNASDTRELSFQDVRVPAANLLGQEGRGYAQFLRILDEGRIAIAALATGLAQGCVDESVKYAKERHAFGRPIGANQAIQFKIADMEMKAHTARLAWRDAASRLVAGEPFKKEAALAKLYSSTVAVDNARDATQIHGGYGFMNEYPVARMWRDSKILEIGEGTSEVQRMLIARELGLAG